MAVKSPGRPVDKLDRQERHRNITYTHSVCVVCRHPARKLMEAMYLQGASVSKLVQRFGDFTYATFYRHCREGAISEEIQEDIGVQAQLIEADAQQIIANRNIPKGPEKSDSLIDLLREFHEQTFNDAVRAEDTLELWEVAALKAAGKDDKALAKVHKEKVYLISTIQGMKISAIKTLTGSIEHTTIMNFLERNGGSDDADKIENFDRLRTFVHLSNLAHKADDVTAQGTQVLPAKVVSAQD